MNVDQLDELIRKYLSTGVAVVLVLVGPAAAPSGTAARPQTAATSAHSTGAAPTNSRAPSHHDTDRSTRTHHRAHDDGGAHRKAPSRTERGHHLGPGGPRPLPRRRTLHPIHHRACGRRRPDRRRHLRLGQPQPRGRLHRRPLRLGHLRRPRPREQGHPLPGAAKVADGVLTIDGDAEGTTAGMAWGSGGAEVRPLGRSRPRPRQRPHLQRPPAALARRRGLPRGGEIDFMEMTDHNRQATNVFLHHGEDNAQEHGIVEDRRHAVAQLGGRVDAEGHHHLRRRRAVVAHRQHGRPPARPDAPVHPARLVPPEGRRRGQAVADAGRLGAAVPARRGTCRQIRHA